MGRIVQLDAHTANMIAAGEVVERPSGVVKELVENSIDAGATRIEITTEQGGLKSLCVRDNGCGMDSDDATTAFKRHATSKIVRSEDLFNIHTLGFRGEALPSIASVSKLTLSTSDGTQATRVCVEYGTMTSVCNYPCNQGTEIVVEGLFYRTPARLKHMRTGSYENSLIQSTVMSFALSHPEIAFSMISEGSETFCTSGQGDLSEVLYRCYGKGVFEAAHPVSFEDYDYKVSGVLIDPSCTRAARTGEHLFLNGRMVRNHRLYQAVEDGYQSLIPQGRKPLFVLNIEMDAQLVDVNVHPSKWEVRLSKENQLEYLLRDNTKAAFTNTVAQPEKPVVYEHVVPIRMEPETYTSPYVAEPARDIPVPPRQFKPEEVQTKEEKTQAVRSEEYVECVKVSGLKEAPTQMELHEEKPVRTLEAMRVLGQFHGTYILAETERGLAVIDQLKAQKRIAYEDLLKKLGKESVQTDLLVPLSFTITQDLAVRLDEVNEAVQELCVEFEDFGSGTLIVRSLPSWMKEVNAQEFLQDVLDGMISQRSKQYMHQKKSELAMKLVQAMHLTRGSLSTEEMNVLVERLGQCENPYRSISGEAILIVLDELEIRKEFK